ncbi:MAG: GH32 C-terminal domain-containing protein [Propionicimonas sp.]
MCDPHQAGPSTRKESRRISGRRAQLRIVVGEHSVEVFADGGAATLTARILPEAAGMSVSAQSGDVAITSLHLDRPLPT